MRREAARHESGEEVDQVTVDLGVVSLQVGELVHAHSTYIAEPQLSQALRQPEHLKE